MHLKMNQANAVRKKLIEDKHSTYEEMLEHFVNVIGIEEKTAKEYLCCRNAYQHQYFQSEIKPTS